MKEKENDMMITINQTILNGPHVPSHRLCDWLQSYAPSIKDNHDAIAAAYTTYGELTKIGNLLPFAQAAKETGWFSSPRWVRSYNPAGLGATNDGAWGGTFSNPAEGILTQYAHLVVYAMDETACTAVPLWRFFALVDPRFDAVKQRGWVGSVQQWTHLNGKWAYPGRNYGESIIERANVLLEKKLEKK